MSIGWVRPAPAEPVPLEELLRRADQAMYTQKKLRKQNQDGANHGP